jgi:hypothetical protein
MRAANAGTRAAGGAVELAGVNIALHPGRRFTVGKPAGLWT